jgi:hypothetical protein
MLAEDVIQASNFHPLVLANLGNVLKGEGSTDPAVWRAVKEELFDVMSDEDESYSGPLGFGNLMYPRTAVSSTLMAINILPSEAQSLLLLATLFCGPYVPELVLKVVFEKVHGNRSRTYLKWRNHLEERSFIQVHSHAVSWSSVPVQTVSISRLRQYFIRRLKRESLNLLVQSILQVDNSSSNQGDPELVVALSAMYGVEELRAGAAKIEGINIRQNVSEWRCVEPFVWLLETKGEEAWERQCLESAKEVITLYFCLQITYSDIDV